MISWPGARNHFKIYNLYSERLYYRLSRKIESAQWDAIFDDSVAVYPKGGRVFLPEIVI